MPLKRTTSSAAKTKSAPTIVATGLVRASGRPADLVAFDDAVVGYFVEAADLLGVPKSVAAIYGICFASPEPLSFSEIDERLDISSGSISQGLRVLKEVGALKVADATRSSLSVIGDLEKTASEGRPPIANNDQLITGARSAARYAPDLELRKLILHWLEQRLQPQLNSGHSRLEAVLKSVPAGHNGSASVIQMRLESLQTWHDKARSLLPIAKTFLKLT